MPRVAAQIATRAAQGFFGLPRASLDKSKTVGERWRRHSSRKTAARALANRRLHPLGHVSITAKLALTISGAPNKPACWPGFARLFGLRRPQSRLRHAFRCATLIG